MQPTKRFVASLFLLAMLCGTQSPIAADAETLRPLRTDDWADMEELFTSLPEDYGYNYIFAPDGQHMAFVRSRVEKDRKDYQLALCQGCNSDVWLQEAAGKKPVNITQGLANGSGWFYPRWSPDGNRLALLSTRGGNVMLWVWEKEGNQLRRLTNQAVDFNLFYDAGFVWVDATHLLCAVRPEGELAKVLISHMHSAQIAMKEWPKTSAGKEATASVLNSGAPTDRSDQPQGRLLLIDAVSGESRVIVEGDTRDWQLSPNGQALAYTRLASAPAPVVADKLHWDGGKFALEVVDLAGRKLVARQETSSDVLTDSVRWSPGGIELAYIAYNGSRTAPPELYRLTLGQASQEHANTAVASRRVRVDLDGLDASSGRLLWTAADDLIVQAKPSIDGKKAPESARADWWLIARDGTSRNLTETMPSSPKTLMPLPGQQAFAGIVDGEVWRIALDNNTPRNLTEGLVPRVVKRAWPWGTEAFNDMKPGRLYSTIVVSTQIGQRPLDYHVLDLESAEIKPLAKPAEEVRLGAYSPEGEAIFYSSNRNGSFVWRTPPGGHPKLLFSANTFLRKIAEGEFRPIEYTSLNGEKLKGWIVLPVDYEEGKRYPLLVHAYLGQLFFGTGDASNGRPPYWQRVFTVNPLNMQIPAAHGYAVLLPTMPVEPRGEADDPLFKLTNGVLPALEKAIEMGIADPERAFVFGQSFGGFSTYGLVTQTDRFKAAVSLAGHANMVSSFGTFSATTRYTDRAHEDFYNMDGIEPGSFRMGSPPWKDLGRYLRNSPITYVDRVKTPLLIIYGDMDDVPMQQGEEFFMSLYRQGKRAQFLRYWGEGHVLQSPANIRDMWNRIFAWFDEFGDISRDADGRLVFEHDRVKSRNGGPPLEPADFERFAEQ